MTLPAHVRDWIIGAEGGYQRDPDDPGGETKFGISKRSYPALDIASLTESDAAGIYERDYWEPCECDQLPAPLALAVFDAAVNQGRSVAIRLLQLAVESVTGRRIAIDGVIGADTIATARAASRQDSEATLTALLSWRAVRYAQTARERAQSEKYLRGWMARLFKLEAACLRLTEA